jgi:5-methylcytosine-specific restriction protein A
MRQRSQFHGSFAWKRARRIAKLQASYQCERCGRVFPGKGELHVHHRKPVKRAPALSFEPANFMVLCAECHNIVEPRTGVPRLGCDIDGTPLSPEHPWNKAGGRVEKS